MTVIKRKLIEVALPLEAINRESAREKSIRHGHPSTLHLWWARRPLAACRAVLFAQLVDDPSSHPDQFPTEVEQFAERQRLFEIVERLVVWENSNDSHVISQARAEIVKSTGGALPPIFDPFAGGGSIPLEAQRLGLEAHASDLNPIAVLINKALIEVPPSWAGQAPVFPGAQGGRLGPWERATGLAEDVRRYGEWMAGEAAKRIGSHYPSVELPDKGEARVIAWLWARTVKCPNPACPHDMPLVSTFWLCKKKGRPAWLDPYIAADGIRFHIRTGTGGPKDPPKVGRGANFRCLACGGLAGDEYIKAEGVAGRLGYQLLATVAQGDRRRVYLEASATQIRAADVPRPQDAPDEELADDPRNLWCVGYGLTRFGDLFTNRQLDALMTFSGLVTETREKARVDALASGMSPSRAREYSVAIALYLAFGVSRLANRQSTICIWNTIGEKVEQTFGRQAIPMSWDFAEANVLSSGTGTWRGSLEWIPKVLEFLPASAPGFVSQEDARFKTVERGVVSTDPPYYDNISYADLSDFFYVWMRRSLGDALPSSTSMMLTPKAAELVAAPHRHEGHKDEAEAHFEAGFLEAFRRIHESQLPDYPMTIFYAFKQSETDSSGTASTGWETMLNALLQSGFGVSATWPMRTERDQGLKSGTNVLASSIVLVCRPRPSNLEATSRRGFVATLKQELPTALRELQQGSIAPVDLAQAAIGPGMAVFSRYSRVAEADGSEMSVRIALGLINQVLDEVLTEQEGDFDPETRFCIKWFAQFGWNEGLSGEVDVLARAVNTSVSVLERGGVFRAAAGRARLLEPAEMTPEWNPAEDKTISVWEVTVRVAHALHEQGADQAGAWLGAAASRVDIDAVKELSYLLYALAEKRGWSETALLFNTLGTSWGEVRMVAHQPKGRPQAQVEFDLDAVE